ncbi:unnamed protein product [Notodromas monacha]|uniref:BHLH domain-containing protein n=1 Tax=Notodromas monacha TaxID=399045 RepID=A0A7R9GGS2_9CRUS|nr:unnamed protein product [Notodromas monacha]CAG0922023.1 unnamed protein product [Notodromas monacha]
MMFPWNKFKLLLPGFRNPGFLGSTAATRLPGQEPWERVRAGAGVEQSGGGGAAAADRGNQRSMALIAYALMPVATVTCPVKAMKMIQHEVSTRKRVLKKKASKLRVGGKSEEIRTYLSKLQELVPFVPKDKKLSKLEVIEGVIDYICHLQYALQTHPAVVGASNSGERRPLCQLDERVEMNDTSLDFAS